MSEDEYRRDLQVAKSMHGENIIAVLCAGGRIVAGGLICPQCPSSDPANMCLNKRREIKPTAWRDME